MAPRKEKLKQTIAEDRKRLLLHARQWPFATWMSAAVGVAGLLLGLATGGGVVPIVFAGTLGVALGLGLKKAFDRVEDRIKIYLQGLADRIDIVEQSDPKDKTAGGPNPLLDEFSLEYCGGHSAWKIAGKRPYGMLQVYERSLVFKNLKNRFRVPMARLNRVTLETAVQVRVKHLDDVVLPSARNSRLKALKPLFAAIGGRQRYIVVDCADDTGAQRLMVFWPRGGNPRVAKNIKEALDRAIKRSVKARASRGVESSRAPSETRTTLVERRRPTSFLPPDSPAPGSASGPTPASAPAKLCPFCRFSLKSPIVLCSVCGSELHAGCWKANFGCATPNCKGKPTESAPVEGPNAATMAKQEGT